MNGSRETTYSLRGIDSRRNADRWQIVPQRELLSAFDGNEVEFLAFSPEAAREVLRTRNSLGRYRAIRDAAADSLRGTISL